MSKKIKHMGMTMTEEEHKCWHQEHSEITPEQHGALMKKMGISEKEDKEWHKIHGRPFQVRSKPEKKPINPFAVGGGFLTYCVKQGWLVQEGRGRNARYYATKEGKKEMGRFGIKI